MNQPEPENTVWKPVLLSIHTPCDQDWFMFMLVFLRFPNRSLHDGILCTFAEEVRLED